LQNGIKSGIINQNNYSTEVTEMKEVTKETIIGDILDNAPESAPLFLEIGMHCLGCPSSRGETIEMACEVHGVDADELVEKINAMLAGK